MGSQDISSSKPCFAFLNGRVANAMADHTGCIDVPVCHMPPFGSHSLIEMGKQQIPLDCATWHAETKWPPYWLLYPHSWRQTDVDGIKLPSTHCTFSHFLQSNTNPSVTGLDLWLLMETRTKRRQASWMSCLGLIEQGKSEGFHSCDRPSNLIQIWFKSSTFQPVWPWNLMDDLKKIKGHLFNATLSDGLNHS